MEHHQIVARRYQIRHEVGRGNYGRVYAGRDIETGRDVAIKVQKTPEGSKHIANEITVYKQLGNNDGWPTFLWGGINKQREIEHTVIVTERLGPSMQLLLEQNSEEEGEGDGKNPRGFSLKTVLMLAPQMIDLVQLVHSKKIVHGDIRPNHFMFGVADEKMRLVDFGSAVPYIDNAGNHIPYEQVGELSVSFTFDSIQSNSMYSISRRDDVESLGYVLVGLAKGSLPWDYLEDLDTSKMSSTELRSKYLDEKKQQVPAKLCEGMEQEFELYFNHTLGLSFEAEPDYSYLKSLFQTVYRRNGYPNDGVYDWNIKNGTIVKPADSTITTATHMGHGYIINNEYQVHAEIASGSYGKVYTGKCLHSNEPIIIKVERKEVTSHHVEGEVAVYKDLGPSSAIPELKWAGTEGKKYHVMVLKRLGPSLQALLEDLPSRKYSLKTTLMIAPELVERIRFIHSKGYVHRDIKPANFMVGLGEDQKKVYVIDFGFAYKYIVNGEHVPHLENVASPGTLRYSSIYANSKHTQSRRDDMMGVGYVIMYLLRGDLPWQHVQEDNKQKQKALYLESKIVNTPKVLCEGYPKEFELYFNHVMSLEFEQEPDYEYLKNLFYSLYEKEGFPKDNLYDWDIARAVTDQEFNGTRRNLRKSSSDKAPLFGDLDIVSQEDIGIHLSKAMLSEYKHNLPLTTQQIIDTNSHFEYSSVYIIGIFCLVLLIVYRNVFRFRKI